MTAHHRFVFGGWLLLAGITLATIGVVAWSHLNSHHRVLARVPTNCTAPVPAPTQPDTPGTIHLYIRSRQPGDICTGGGFIVEGTNTTPNHVPGGLLVVLAGALGVAGVVLLRRPAEATSR
jgi:hypothetical protein